MPALSTSPRRSEIPAILPTARDWRPRKSIDFSLGFTPTLPCLRRAGLTMVNNTAIHRGLSAAGQFYYFSIDSDRFSRGCFAARRNSRDSRTAFARADRRYTTPGHYFSVKMSWTLLRSKFERTSLPARARPNAPRQRKNR